MNGITIGEAAELCGVPIDMFTAAAVKHRLIPKSKRVSWDTVITVETWLDINNYLPLTDSNGRFIRMPHEVRRQRAAARRTA
jgi:hypothetical protein